MKKMSIFFSNGEIPTYNLLLWNPKNMSFSFYGHYFCSLLPPLCVCPIVFVPFFYGACFFTTLSFCIWEMIFSP
jgi:hypothetical protein